MNTGRAILSVNVFVLLLFAPSLVLGQSDVMDEQQVDPFAGLQIPPSMQYSQEQLDPLYQPTVTTLSELGRSFAQSAPLVAGFLITIFVGWISGRVAEAVLKRIIKRVFEHEKLLKLVGMSKTEFETSSWSAVHNLIPLTVKWFVYIIFFVVAIELFQIPEATDALSELWIWLPRLITFIILISVGFIATRIALKWMSDTKPELFGESGSMQIVKGIVQGIIYSVVLGIGVTTLGIGENIVPILFWVILSGVMGIAIVLSFAFRDVVKGWVLGEAVKKDKMFGVGAEVRVGEFEGTIKEIGVIHTVIALKADNKTIMLPNSRFSDTVIEIKKAKPEEKKEEKTSG